MYVQLAFNTIKFICFDFNIQTRGLEISSKIDYFNRFFNTYVHIYNFVAFGNFLYCFCIFFMLSFALKYSLKFFFFAKVHNNYFYKYILICL